MEKVTSSNIIKPMQEIRCLLFLYNYKSLSKTLELGNAPCNTDVADSMEHAHNGHGMDMGEPSI